MGTLRERLRTVPAARRAWRIACNVALVVSLPWWLLLLVLLLPVALWEERRDRNATRGWND